MGQVFHRSAPVLTWRRGQVLRIPTPQAMDVPYPESTVQRISRLPTRRVESLPVVPNVVRSADRSPAWSIAMQVTIALSLACGVALGIVALDAYGSGPAIAHRGAATKADVVHVLGAGHDKLSTDDDELAALAAQAQVVPPTPRKVHAQAAHHPATRGGHPHPGRHAKKTHGGR